ncbi:glutathione S-transferase family protein [Halieaceae bacterium IMCC14734]|uniref:Glutathione S-transferase family protein n=1 Tax=Candidatus Litorirhabdus singularis TaxID=2518993 RepID=A0ABT3TCN3_9GAMM|nr:glutathione S-transferase family protein [Candidatus Litorirhabdus singularis]MCX2979595.1 glutathione S-transferase family protein [Candidatus Litorirhabdus singularis]
MGLLVDGKWADQWYETEANQGEFKRQDSLFRNWITADGSAGPSGAAGFKAEAGRYHLYVSLACPWAHRTLILRELKGLSDIISVSVVDALMLDQGWTFSEEYPDHLYGMDKLFELYNKARPGLTSRVTVPVLWDKQRETIVSNESAEIIRMFNSAFNGVTGNTSDYYPIELRAEIDALNELIYPTINNGVYRAGFATSQEAYATAYGELFTALDELEQRLETRRYLTGDHITEADWRLFTTLLRFDPVYFGHFKTNRQRIEDYPNLSGYVRDLFQQPGIAATVDLPYIKQHYYGSHKTINPTGVIPLGQEIDFSRPHERALLASAATSAA